MTKRRNFRLVPGILAQRISTLLVSFRNMRAGRIVQTQEPMVLPTRPRTSSMSGTRIPITRQIKMTAAVIMLNLEGKRTKCVFFLVIRNLVGGM